MSAGMISAVCVDWKEKKTLLVLNTDPEKPLNFWGLPGGKMKEGENIEAAALRELRQETNQNGEKTRYKAEIPKTGLYGDYVHRFIIVKIIPSENGLENELKNNEDPEAIPKWIAFDAILSGRVRVFPSHVRGLVLLLEKMVEEKMSKKKLNKHGLKILSEGPPATLELLKQLKNSFDGKGRYIIPFYRRR
jgi:ADP-ribose pyrophosphatase YjhB (NUDIX family)